MRDPQNGSRPGLKVNPEFFNNAPKHKGDIEIFTKTPPREFIVENNSAAIKKNPVVQEGDPSVQIEESPNKTYKYTVSAKKSPRSEENMFSNRQNVTSEFKPEGQIEEETNKRTSFPPNNRDLPSPPHPKRSPREQTEAKMRAFQNIPGQQDRMEQEERRREKPRFSDDDFSNVFKQLDHITKQQEKMMESMNNFQNTTLNELKQLKARVKDVEDHIYKSQHTQKAPPAYPYQPPPYGYVPPPYQPLVHPQPQAPYPISYSNYAPAYFYPPGPGIGPNPGRPVDPNWMRRPQGEHPPNQSFQGRQSMAQPSRDRERYERGSPNQNRNDGDRIQPEINRVQNRGEPNKESKGHDDFHREHTKKPSKTKMEDRGLKNSIWERLQDLLSRSQVNAAFELCLTEGDEETLIALMKETGVIVEYLENPIVENILTGLKSRVFDEAHRDLMLNWIEKSVTTDAGVSRGTFIALHDILMQLLEEGTGLNHASTEKVKKVRREIQQLLDNQPEESELKNLAPKEDDEMENEITDEREGTEGNEIK